MTDTAEIKPPDPTLIAKAFRLKLQRDQFLQMLEENGRRGDGFDMQISWAIWDVMDATESLYAHSF